MNSYTLLLDARRAESRAAQQGGGCERTSGTAQQGGDCEQTMALWKERVDSVT